MSPPTPRTSACPDRRRFLAGLGSLLLATGLGLVPGRAEANLDVPTLRRSMTRLYGRGRLDVLEEWLALLDRLAPASISTRLREVNAFFNDRVRWLDDIEIWGEKDYWATPLETLGKAEGDCEDYAIAKYITLTQLGVPVEQLRMIYVRALIGRRRTPQAHMVLGYYMSPEAEPLVLDNIEPAIQPASRRDDLTPVFSFNSEGLWAGGSRESRGDPLAKLSRWRSVIERMRAQGFI